MFAGIFFDRCDVNHSCNLQYCYHANDGNSVAEEVEKHNMKSAWSSVMFCIYIEVFVKGALAYRVSIFLKYFVFASLCSFICLQAVYQLSGSVCKATWNGCPSYSASYFHFTLCD